MKIDPEALYVQLGHLISTMPDFENGNWNSPEARLWLGRASALIEMDGLAASVGFTVAAEGLGSVLHDRNVQKIISTLYRAFAKAELAAPTAIQGSFIPIGEAFTAHAAVSKVLANASTSTLIVDPYSDATLLTDFAVLAPEGVLIQVLSCDENHKPGFACWCLTARGNLAFIAKQMGHIDYTMLVQIYAKWMDDESSAELERIWTVLKRKKN